MKWLRVILVILLVLWEGMIYGFSAQNAEASSAVSGGVCYRVCQLTVKNFERLPPAQQQEAVHDMQKPVRKLAHFCEYGLGGVLAASLLLTLPKRPKRSWIYGGLLGLLSASADEFHQIFVEDRGPGVIDIVLDLSGFVCGMALLWLIVQAVCRRGKKGCDR